MELQYFEPDSWASKNLLEFSNLVIKRFLVIASAISRALRAHKSAQSCSMQSHGQQSPIPASYWFLQGQNRPDVRKWPTSCQWSTLNCTWRPWMSLRRCSTTRRDRLSQRPAEWDRLCDYWYYTNLLEVPSSSTRDSGLVLKGVGPLFYSLCHPTRRTGW